MGAQAGASNGSVQAERGHVPAAKDPRHKDGPQKKQKVPGNPCGGRQGGPGWSERGPTPHGQAFPPGAGRSSDFSPFLCQLSLCLVDLGSSLPHASPLDVGVSAVTSWLSPGPLLLFSSLL